MQAVRQALVRGLRTAFIFIFVPTWMYTALPSLFSFPPKVEKANAAVNFVQASRNTTGGSTVSVTSSITYAGDLLVVVADWDTSFILSSISDTQGNLYATAIGPISWSSNNRTQMFYAKNIKGGANAVTVKLSGSPGSTDELHVVEYSGADTVSPLDATSVATGNSTALDSGSVSTSSGNELIFGYGDIRDGNPLIAGNGFVPRTQNNGVSAFLSEDKYVTSAGSYNATETAVNPNSWIMMMATFKSNMSGYEPSSRVDMLSDSRISATSNHTLSFTPNKAISGSSTLTFAFPSGFAANIDCGDIDAATSSPFNFNYPSCAPTATAWGAQVKAVITNVQWASKNAGAASTNAKAFSTDNIAGDLIVVAVDWNNLSANVISVTDTNGNTYASALGPINWNGLAPTYRGQIFYAKNIKGGANTVTVTLSAAATSSFESYIHEYSGADTISPLDAVSSATSNSGTAMDSGSATTHFANELIFGAGFEASAVSAAGAGFTIRSTFDSNMTEDKSVTSIGSYNATETGSTFAWIMMMATFKAAGSGSVLTLTAPLDSAVHVATSTPMSIYIGSNATTTQQGVHWITNPSTAGAYTISLGGTSGNSGNFLVAIGGGQTVAAQVAESLALTVNATASSIKYVQSIFHTDTIANPPIDFASNNAVGDLIILALDWNNQSVTVNSITDTNGNTYVSAAGPVNGQGGLGSWRDQIFYAKNINAGANTVTVHFSAAVTSELYLHEYSGADRTSPLDVTASSVGSSSTANSGSKTTNFPNELIFGYCQDIGVTCSPGTNFTTRQPDSNNLSEDMIATSTGSYSASANLSGSGDWVMSMATFKPYPNCAADDGATITQVNTTASSVPFGTISANTFYQGCQDLIVSTNAGGGYSLTGQESSALLTSNGTSIPDTRCDAGTCTESAAAAWATASNNGFGHTCANQGGVHDCASAYSSGVNFKQFANIAGGEAAQAIMTSSTPSSATGRVKYRLSRSAQQAAGTYTNIVDYILTGTF